MEKGKLIVIEGACDGIGKTTQFTLLKERLEKEGETVITHHFPSYHTQQGKPVEMYLKGEFGNLKELSPYFINGLYANDRDVTWRTILKKEIESGNTVLLDRYTTSSMIYQGAVLKTKAERKKFVDYVANYEYKVLGIGEPDKVIFLHAPFDLVTRMREARKSNDGVANDIHERDMEFMKKVYNNAMEVSEYLHWDSIDCTKGESFDTVESIHQKVYAKVRN